MNDLARILISIGIVCIIMGVLLLFLGKVPGLGRLPGDILIKKENFTFYFPVTTSILLSVLISFLLHLWHQR